MTTAPWALDTLSRAAASAFDPGALSDWWFRGRKLLSEEFHQVLFWILFAFTSTIASCRNFIDSENVRVCLCV